MNNINLATEQDDSMNNNQHSITDQSSLNSIQSICASAHSTESGRYNCMQYLESLYPQEIEQDDSTNNQQQEYCISSSFTPNGVLMSGIFGCFQKTEPEQSNCLHVFDMTIESLANNPQLDNIL